MSKNKRQIVIVILVIILLAGGAAAFAYRDAIRGILPLLRPAPPLVPAEPGPGSGATTTPQSGAPGTNTTGIPLQLPAGFSISIFAKDLPGARVMAFDEFGNMWLSQTSQGAVAMLEIGDDDNVVRQGAVLRNLRRPHGLAFSPAFALYVGEEHRVSRVLTYSDAPIEKVVDLPPSGGHFTRTVGFGPDGRLYVSIGSSCNVCAEADERRAKIFSMNFDGSDFKEYARGLRNAVFFAWHPQTKKMWATEMGRDHLGDNLPPDEINIVEEGKNYGWPICYGKNIHDTNFDKNTYVRNPCMEPFETPSFIDIPAHSAPLGLVFVNSDAWPADYRDDLIVAYHGSWNRSVPTGYKLVRFKFDASGNYQGSEDFIAGWLSGGSVYGRPVDVKFGPDGALYVSDDHAGVIYKVTYAS